MQILHILPHSITKPHHHYLGSTKDIRGRTEYFMSRGFRIAELVVERRSDDFLIEKFKSLQFDQYDMVFFELAIYPGAIKYLKQTVPHLARVVRPINAEFYHQLHLIRAQQFNLKSLSGLNHTQLGVRTALWRLRIDIACAWAAHSVFSITEWERTKYWAYLAPGRDLYTVPYFLPHIYADPLPPRVKLSVCICLMTTSQNIGLFNMDAGRNFVNLVNTLGSDCSEWRFEITGHIQPEQLATSTRIDFTGYVEHPYQLLAQSKAMALLSDYGYGFKTKILDAIQNRCYVLVTQNLYGRLPEEVKPYCIVVDIKSIKSFKDALARCNEPFPAGDPNELLRERAYSAMDKAFFVKTN